MHIPKSKTSNSPNMLTCALCRCFCVPEGSRRGPNCYNLFTSFALSRSLAQSGRLLCMPMERASLINLTLYGVFGSLQSFVVYLFLLVSINNNKQYVAANKTQAHQHLPLYSIALYPYISLSLTLSVCLGLFCRGVQCHDTVNGAQCDSCPVGYEGDGRTCTLRNPCLETPCPSGKSTQITTTTTA